MLTAHHISCTRGGQSLFQRLSLTLNPNEGIWIQGANGAGKSTLLKILTGLLMADKGYVTWKGEKISNNVGYYQAMDYLGHKDGFNDALTLLENLRYYHILHNYPKEHFKNELNYLNHLNLKGVIDQPLHTLSLGQRRKASIFRLISHAKPLWILDEPFTGLDTVSIEVIESVLVKHLKENKLLIITSHQPLKKMSPFLQNLNLSAQC